MLFLSDIKSKGCTIFYISKDGYVLAGNNEDWKDPKTIYYIYAPSLSINGWIKFGFAGGFPQGGMNEHGLFWDATGCAYLAMPVSEKNKEKYNGPIMKKIMEECATIEDAKGILEKYYCEDQYRAQYLIGDSTGSSMIVEGDNILMKTGDCQVLTNFYQSHPELGGYPCWRYERATSMLKEAESVSPYLIGAVLSATHQEGMYPSQYSNIYDLRNRYIYLFYFHNYEEFLTIDLIKEMNNGSQRHDLPEIFSNIKVMAPDENKVILKSSISLKWNGIKSTEYDVYCSTDANFLNCVPIRVKTSNTSKNENIVGFLILCMGFTAMVGLKRNQKSIIATFAVFVILLCSVKCEKADMAPDNSIGEKWSLHVDDLEKGKDYYWKIVAYPNGSESIFTETIVHHFKTGE